MQREKENFVENTIRTMDLEGPGCVAEHSYTDEEMKRIREANQEICDQRKNADLKMAVLQGKLFSAGKEAESTPQPKKVPEEETANTTEPKQKDLKDKPP